MKRVLIALAATASFACAGLVANTASAQHPHCGNRYGGGYGGGPRIGLSINVGGGYGSYGGYGGYGSPYTVGSVYPTPYYPVVPYGAGYVSGYQPYQQMYSQRPYYGLGF